MVKTIDSGLKMLYDVQDKLESDNDDLVFEIERLKYTPSDDKDKDKNTYANDLISKIDKLDEKIDKKLSNDDHDGDDQDGP